MEYYYISLFDKENRKLSKKVSLKEIIYNQEEVEFEFSDEEIGRTILPYKDFLFFKDDYDVVLEFDCSGE